MIEVKNSKCGTIKYLKADKVIAIKCKVINHHLRLKKSNKNLLFLKKDGFVGFKTIIYGKTLTAQDFNNGYLQSNKCLPGFTSVSNNIKDNIYSIKTIK